MSFLRLRYPHLVEKVLNMLTNNPNENTPETLGLAIGLNQYAHCNSSPRMVMWGSHISQAPVIAGAAPKRIYGGLESKYGQGTWKAEIKEDGLIKKIIPKYPTNTGMFKLNPCTHIVYQTKGHVKTFDILPIDLYHASHQSFGYRNKLVNQHLMRENSPVLKGTKFAQSPNVLDNGMWVYGRDIVVANLSVHGVIEDGVIMRRGALEYFKTTQVSKRSASVGKQFYFLNAYGNDLYYRGFPEIGDHIHEDGLLFAMRKYNPETADMDMDVDSLQYIAVDRALDRCVYATGGAQVTDITIMHSHLFKGRTMNCTPIGMDRQLERYYDATGRQYRTILDTEKALRREHKNIELTPAFERLCVEAEDFHYAPHAGALKRTYRTTPLDEWNVEIQFAHEHLPSIGSKVSGQHGDKSIICGIWDDDKMPYNEFGLVADMISSGGTTVGRMNVGRIIEQYMTASAWHHERRLKVCEDPVTEFLEYLAVASPIAFSWLIDLTEAQILEQVEQAKEFFTYCLPPHSPNLNLLLCAELQSRWETPRTHLTYTDERGRTWVTDDKILLGWQHVILSEKNGYDWASVADDAKCQIYGPPAKLSNADKYSSPRRRQCPRGLGEAENRNSVASVGPIVTSRVLEYQNNPDAVRLISHTLATHPTPTNVECIIHDGLVAPGYSRPLLLGNHIINAAGVQLSQRVPRGVM